MCSKQTRPNHLLAALTALARAVIVAAHAVAAVADAAQRLAGC